MSTKTLPCSNSAAEEGNGSFKGKRTNSVRMPRLPKTLSPEEKKYLLAVDRGDVAGVTRMIRKAQLDGSLDINCMDPLGRGALLMAIEAQNLSMVETLIVNGVRTADALLHAIDKQFVEAVELLLEHEELVHNEGEPYSWENIDRDTATFTPEITPLILASHRNNYEILKILLDRGATLPMPHDFRCTCQECTDGVRGDCLRHSASRINSFKALASPSLIALTSTDPLLTSFELSWELKQLAIAEKEFRADYLELRKQSSDFAVSLLSQTRTSHELEVMLNFDPHNAQDDFFDFEGSDEGGLARLRLAIKYKQKKFVAHPSVQQFLSAMWYEGLPGFRQKTSVGKCVEIFRVISTFPLYCFWYMLAPNSSTGKIVRKPFMKFLLHASSYLFFLLLLILVSQRAEEQVKEFLWNPSGSVIISGKEHYFRKPQRGNPPQYLEYLVAIYVLGFIVEETRELFRNGFISYVGNLWNAIDFLRNSLYCAVFLLRSWAYLEQQREISEDPEKAYIPREEWDDFDPHLIAEGLFAAANIFSALKLVHVSTINPHLGPLQISLGRMVFDILKFFFFYTLVLFAFACGLNQLLWYFADLERQKCYSLPGGLPDWNRAGESCMKWRRFGNLFESSQSLFWASFGMVGLADFELTGIKSYTRFWGLLMFGSYCVINVIVLLNLLIAMLSNTYAAIEERADTEWKFARTKLWLSYFDEDSSLPSPFNLIPTPKSVKRLLTRFIPNLAKIGKSLKRREAKVSALREQAMQYRSVMRALVWRYVSGLQRKSEETEVTEDDVNEVKGEISALRCDLMEIFRKNGMNIASVTQNQRPAPLGRKTREWERRLLKGFHVAPAAGDEKLDIIDPDMEKVDKVIEDSDAAKEGGADRFRRMARLALLNREVIARPSNHLSHIGRSTSSESFRSRQSLKQAMEEARKMVLGSVEKSPRSERDGKELSKEDSLTKESEVKPPQVPARGNGEKLTMKPLKHCFKRENSTGTGPSQSKVGHGENLSSDSGIKETSTGGQSGSVTASSEKSKQESESNVGNESKQIKPSVTFASHLGKPADPTGGASEVQAKQSPSETSISKASCATVPSVSASVTVGQVQDTKPFSSETPKSAESKSADGGVFEAGKQSHAKASSYAGSKLEEKDVSASNVVAMPKNSGSAVAVLPPVENPESSPSDFTPHSGKVDTQHSKGEAPKKIVQSVATPQNEPQPSTSSVAESKNVGKRSSSSALEEESSPRSGVKSDSQLLLPSIENVKTIKKKPGAWF